MELIYFLIPYIILLLFALVGAIAAVVIRMLNRQEAIIEMQNGLIEEVKKNIDANILYNDITMFSNRTISSGDYHLNFHGDIRINGKNIQNEMEKIKNIKNSN